MSTAQKCSREGCFNKTNDPSGTCYQHREATYDVRRPAAERARLATVPSQATPAPLITDVDVAIAEVDAGQGPSSWMSDTMDDKEADSHYRRLVNEVADNCDPSIRSEFYRRTMGSDRSQDTFTDEEFGAVAIHHPNARTVGDVAEVWVQFDPKASAGHERDESLPLVQVSGESIDQIDPAALVMDDDDDALDPEARGYRITDPAQVRSLYRQAVMDTWYDRGEWHADNGTAPALQIAVENASRRISSREPAVSAYSHDMYRIIKVVGK